LFKLKDVEGCARTSKDVEAEGWPMALTITVAGNVTSESGSPRLSSTCAPAPLLMSSAMRATHALGNVGPAVTSAANLPTSTGWRPPEGRVRYQMEVGG